MATNDAATQVTQIYNKLVSINSSLAKLALLSTVNTIQGDLQSRLNSIAERLNTLEQSTVDLQMTISDLLLELRSK
jgi:hypothetical protein